MQAVVTGGTGFIGRFLVRELLDRGYGVRVVTRRPETLPPADVEVARGDLRRPETLPRAIEGADVVFHNAAYAADHGPASIFRDINVQGSRHLLEACRKTGVDRLVYTSSAGAYGFPRTMEPLTEDSPTRPMNAYQHSKLEAERLLLQDRNLEVSAVRPPLVLGPGGEASRLLLQRLEQEKLPYFGSGDTFISLVHPVDAATCLRLAAERAPAGQVFNAVSFVCTVQELFESLARALGVSPPRRHLPYPLAYGAAIAAEGVARLRGTRPSLTRFRVKSFGTHRCISARKAQEVLGFVPRYDLAATVEDMVLWHSYSAQQPLLSPSAGP